MATNIIIDKVEDDSYWITGTANCNSQNYEWYAKVEDEKHKGGVEKGRVIKLTIRKGELEEGSSEDEFWKGVVANYDRTWVTKPLDQAATEVFYTILDELEKIESYKNRIYGGSLIKKVVAKTKNTFSFGA